MRENYFGENWLWVIQFSRKSVKIGCQWFNSHVGARWINMPEGLWSHRWDHSKLLGTYDSKISSRTCIATDVSVFHKCRHFYKKIRQTDLVRNKREYRTKIYVFKCRTLNIIQTVIIIMNNNVVWDYVKHASNSMNSFNYSQR